ncbi:MAG TPA: TA system VapC family ribonuclease toxin [Bryobacteraceae bacterium]|nr:TA system VapC family ribonuclease toxin [Bryobacteraceae bacterium]
MTLFFPDVNVWLALSVVGHTHGGEAWSWLQSLPDSTKIAFCRYTQLGLLRLLTNPSVMGDKLLNVREAWDVYDRWIKDPTVVFLPEPRTLEAPFREATTGLTAQNSSNWIGDCYLVAYAKECGATLVTFDKAMLSLASKRGCRAVRC